MDHQATQSLDAQVGLAQSLADHDKAVDQYPWVPAHHRVLIRSTDDVVGDDSVVDNAGVDHAAVAGRAWSHQGSTAEVVRLGKVMALRLRHAYRVTLVHCHDLGQADLDQ